MGKKRFSVEYIDHYQGFMVTYPLHLFLGKNKTKPINAIAQVFRVNFFKKCFEEGSLKNVWPIDMQINSSKYLEMLKSIIYILNMSHLLEDSKTSLGLPRWRYWLRTCLSRQKAKRFRFNPWGRKISWRRVQQSTPAFLSGEFHGQMSLVGYSPWSCKELDTTEQLSRHSFFKHKCN